MPTKTQFPEAWLKDVLSYFSELGFFCPPTSLEDDARFVENKANSYNLFPAGPLDPKTYNSGFLAEQEILALDENRIWCKDTEADFSAGDYWYVRTLCDWSRISRGCFQPQSLSEVWEPSRPSNPACPASQEQPIKVSFLLRGRPWSFQLLERSGWLDYNLIGEVNRAVCHTGYQFASVVPDDDQRAYICCFTPVEILKLKNERGWKFHEELLVR
jgi:hypothetical protein